MNIQEILTKYKFSNVGQFRGIVKSLGYSEQYNNGDLLFTRGREEYRIAVDKVRPYTENQPTIEDRNSSMSQICKFFNKEQALSRSYRDTLLKNGIDIINWGDLRSDSKDRFTIIDHNHKICYTGKELYSYASKHNFLLDGKGTQLENGVLSPLTEVGGKPAKVRLTNGSFYICYRKEALVIPDTLYGKKLSKQQQQDLLNGNVVVLSSKKGDILLQVDRDLNAVVLRSEKELSIPVQIGGYELTTADKYLLANNHSLDNKLLHTPEGYIIADVSMNPDKKGFSFSNIQVIPEAKAKEMLEKKTEAQSRNLEAEFKEAVSKNDYEKLAHLKEDGYKPSEEIIKGLGQDSKVDEKEAIVIEKLFGTRPEILKEEVTPLLEQQFPENYIIKLDVPVLIGDYINSLQESGIDVSVLNIAFPSDTAKSEKVDTLFVMVENEKITDWEPVINESDYAVPIKLFSDFEKGVNEKVSSGIDFKNALESNDLEKISLLKDQGYQLSDKDKQLLATVSDNTAIAVHKIFGVKSHTNTFGDVKLAQTGKQEKDITRPLTSTINRAFNDL